MQFFPAALTSAANSLTSAVDSAANAANALAAQASAVSTSTQHGGFDTILSSFIEEGRTDYSGRPSGFAAFEKESGTLDESRGGQIISSLRKRKVDEDILAGLSQVMESGSPATIGRLFGSLSGNMRRGAALEGDERDAFSMLLSKLGFDKDGIEEMLGLSDSGDAKGMWKKLSDKLGKMDGATDVSKTEFSALLKGLDVSDDTKKALAKLFGQADGQTLDGAQLEALLAKASREQTKREKDSAYALSQLRSAVDEALKTAKLNEQNAPIEDKRGSRRSEQTEAFMQNSVLKKTGAADVKRDNAGREEGDASSSRRQNKAAGLEHMGIEADGKGKSAKSAEKTTEKADDKIARLMQRIDAAGVPQTRSGESVNAQAQNLNSMARSFRQEIFSQVENGILQNAHNGARQLTLQLNPGELGQLTVLLSVRQGEVNATIRTDNQDTSSVIREQLVELKASLEAQGLKVKELDVQTQLRDNSLADQREGHQEHNLMRDSSERDRLIRLSRMQRGAGEQGNGNHVLEGRQYSTESTGLHIVA